MNRETQSLTMAVWLALLGPAIGAVSAAPAEQPDAAGGALYITTTIGTAASAGATSFNIEHRPEYGGLYSGVARLTINGGTLCSGALLPGGRHVLTAAHCVTSSSTWLPNFSSGTAQFAVSPNANTYTGSFASVAIQSVLVHPGWSGSFFNLGNDLAILTLAADAPAAAQRYGLYTGTSEFGQASAKSGWGQTGAGSTGNTGGNDWRLGQNIYEMTALQFWNDGVSNPGILMYDFDNGLAANDGFGQMYGGSFVNLGLGSQEVLSAPGDSGGPTFIDGLLAGITSFGLLVGSADVGGGYNHSFGEFGGDTRVSSYAGWILASVPEPRTATMFLAGVAVLAWLVRRRRSPRLAARAL